MAQAKAQAAKLPETGKSWDLVGPSNVGARITDLVVDPRHKDTLYIAAAGGGIWKSTDAGDTFSPVWPANYTQTIGSMAMAPDGELWVGTGEANPSGGGLTFFGDGIYRSKDGGKTWQQWGLTQSGSIGRIVVDPTDSSKVYAAASGNLSGTATQLGVYELGNGKNWNKVLATPNSDTGAIDLAIDPTDHNRIYAALWEKQRNNGARVYGGTGSGLFRSDDGAKSWKRLDNVSGVASYDKTGTGLKQDASLGRIGIAIAPQDPKRVYVIAGDEYGPDKGFYVSNDGGDSFTVSGRAGGNSGYSWWFGRLWVDPQNENHLFSADVNLRESKDGGATWATSSGPHSDQHAMEWDPNVPHRVYLGNDGGAYRSDTDGATRSWVHATYEPFNQSYHIALAADDPNRIATGLQDNGSVRTWTATAGPTDTMQMNAYGGGDGHDVLIDQSDHSVFYECLQVGSCRRHEDVDGTTKSFNFGTRHSDRITTDAPIVLDPTNQDVLYFGGNVLDRSTDRGTTFTQISPPGDYLTGPVPANEDDKGPFYGNEYATITQIAPAKTDPNTIFLGTDTGRLWVTHDLGKNWTEFTGKGLPTRWVNSIIVDPTDAQPVYVAYSGYREGDLAANVWETRDGGKSWTNISANLPNAPVEMLAYDQQRSTVYAATDLGVFDVSIPAHGKGPWKWSRVGRSLPNTPVMDIKISADDKTLYAGTFGRSIWSVPLS
jgi:photosystem II stability/assembly factor-like uncharacterized protein